MNLNPLILGGVILIAAIVEPVPALEVDRAVLPRTTVAGRLLATFRYEKSDGFAGAPDGDSSDFDTSDSAILLRFDKRLYNDKGVGGAMIGLRKVGFESEVEGDVYFNQLNAFFWNENAGVLIGQTRQRNFVVEFPTLRDEDLLDYAYIPDANSYREAEEDVLFAPIGTVDWFLNKGRNAVSLWAGAQTQTNAQGETIAPDINSGGIGWRYEVPETMRYVERIRYAGVFVNYQNVKETVTGETNEGFFSVVAGGESNLNLDPTKVWSTGLQAIYNDGIDDVSFNPADSEDLRLGALRQARSWSVGGYLTFTHRPNLLTRSRAGLLFAYKDYPDQNDATQFSIIPNYVYRLGHGFDIVGQYRFTSFNDGLAMMTGVDTDQTIWAGLVFSFDQTFNDQIGERSSILNMEHGYIQ
ncbi:MAG: hypothetical protein LJE91_16455 [Gammaproteobacteria bacterium]|jgi:hypothetical protein|nr:hypothetical protein [Gammaproteobacteria bacterium]